MRFGYALISEEHDAPSMLAHAELAQEAGFDYLSVSDHFHPWLDAQGESPFAWSVLGALAARASLPLMTAVTCPFERYHPAIVAQAAATVASLVPGGFRLGLGTGEALNEHITGAAWPDPGTRLERLEESIEVIRALFTGDEVTHRGRWCTLDRARLYSLPEETVPIAVAASGPLAAGLAGRVGADLVTVSPDEDLVKAHVDAGGDGHHRFGQMTVAWAPSEDEARQLVHRQWRQSGIGGWDATGDIPTPAGFAQASENVTEEAVVGHTPCGPDLEQWIRAIRPYPEAGFDHLALHQVGSDQVRFLDFARDTLLPALREQLLEDVA